MACRKPRFGLQVTLRNRVKRRVEIHNLGCSFRAAESGVRMYAEFARGHDTAGASTCSTFGIHP